MQLEQQETFTIHGPQLEVLGRVESKLPPPARKRPVAALARNQREVPRATRVSPERRRKSRSEMNPSMDLGQVSTEMAVFQAGRSRSPRRPPVRNQATPLRGVSFRP